MKDTLTDQIDKCREAIVAAILDMLKERAEYVTALERTAQGDLPVSGIALELFPWHGSLGLSLRTHADFPHGQFRYESGDWEHYEFTEGCESPAIESAAELVSDLYQQGDTPPWSRLEMAHLAFWAGAQALLTPEVAQQLQAVGIRAPEITDSFVSSPFEYILIDPDGTVKANYCDIVLAHRVTNRLLENKP